jgi:hypothetical protein
MASPEGLFPRSVPTRAALHARARPEMARETQARPWHLIHKRQPPARVNSNGESSFTTAIDVNLRSGGNPSLFPSPVVSRLPPPTGFTAAGSVPPAGPAASFTSLHRSFRNSFGAGATFRPTGWPKRRPQTGSSQTYRTPGHLIVHPRTPFAPEAKTARPLSARTAFLAG